MMYHYCIAFHHNGAITYSSNVAHTSDYIDAEDRYDRLLDTICTEQDLPRDSVVVVSLTLLNPA